MPQRKREASPTASLLLRILPVLCLALAVGAVARGVARALADADPLQALLGGAFAAWQMLLVASVLACLFAVVQRMRLWHLARAAHRPWAHCRLLVYMLALGAVLHMTWLAPVRGAVAEMLLAVCGGAYALLSAVGESKPKLLKRSRSVLDLAALTLLGLALSAEWALSLWNAWDANPLLAMPGGTAAEHIARERLSPGTLIRGFPINSEGDYDTERERDGRRLVLSIGDSFSVGVVPYPYHFTTVAEQQWPEIEVYNVGLPTIGPKEYLHLIETRVGDLEPEAVVVNVFVGNDINQALNRDSWDLGSWSWLDADHWLVSLYVRRLWAVSGQAVGDEALPEHTSAGVGWGRGDERLEALRRSSLSEWPHLGDPSLERNMMTEATFLGIETTRARRACSRWTAAYGMLFDLLEEMRAACAPAPLLVMLIPDEFQVEDALWEDIVDSTPGESLDRFQPQRLLVEGLAERALPTLDLLPLMREAPTWTGAPDDERRRALYHLRDTHINARGNRLVGLALADFLRQNLP